MNVFELLVVASLTVLLFLLGRFLSRYIGVAGWLVFIVPAGSFWLFVVYAMARSAFLQIRYSLRDRPVCQNGKCGSRQYVLVEPRIDGALFRCRCGDLYFMSPSGDSFSLLLPGNSKQPFMVKNSSGHWEPTPGR